MHRALISNLPLELNRTNRNVDSSRSISRRIKSFQVVGLLPFEWGRHRWNRPPSAASEGMLVNSVGKVACVRHQDGSSSAKTGWHPLAAPLTWKVMLMHFFWTTSTTVASHGHDYTLNRLLQ
jgi:hypothetical protein